MDLFEALNSVVDLKAVLKILKKQKYFLNLSPGANEYVHATILILKCIFAGIGANFVLSTHTTSVLLLGTFINATIHGLFWYVPIYSIILIAINNLMFRHELTTIWLTCLVWIFMSTTYSGEFYLDIYFLLCLIKLLYKIGGREYQMAIIFNIAVLCLNWLVLSVSIRIIVTILMIIASYVYIYFALRPSNDDHAGYALESNYDFRYYYYCINLNVYYILVLLVYKAYGIALRKGYIQDPAEILFEMFDNALDYAIDFLNSIKRN